MKLAIADPPYPPQFSERRDRPGGPIRVTTRSRARRWYGDGTREKNVVPADFHEDAGEWDRPARHRQLLDDLFEGYDGWAIATTMDGLDHYRPLPIPCHVMVWHRKKASPTSHRIASSCEAVIVYTPEERRARVSDLGQVPDLLVCDVSNKVGFAGAKPPRWTRWVLDALGYDPETDTVDDLFPGSGLVTAEIAQGVFL